MCAAAYKGYEGETRHLPRIIWCYQTTEYVEIRREGQTLYIVFRGSNDIFDWLRNADHHLEMTEHGAVHHGHLKGWKELRRAVEEQLSVREHSNVICTGHSRGGNLAALATVDLDVSGVTFGCSNYCDVEYASTPVDLIHYEAGEWMFLRDPVPHLPREQFKAGTTLTLPCYGRPSRMHRIDNYMKQVSR
jgi:alpha-beta hydrolase superfamily lysophospholipase